MAKTEAQVANINARSAISTARTTAAVIVALNGVFAAGHQVEPGTQERANTRCYEIGFRAGVKEALG